MARFSFLPRLLCNKTLPSFHLRHFSGKPVERLRNIWMTGLINPEKIGPKEREMLYAGKIDDTRRIMFSNQEENERYRYIQVRQGINGIMFFREDADTNRSKTIISKSQISQKNNVPAITSINWKDYQMNIIDTSSPCVDFPDHVKTALSAFDGAILVLSSVVGVKLHSVIVDRQMVRNGLPRLIFINKVDEKGADPWDVIDQARSYKLRHRCAAIQVPIGLEDDFKGLVDLTQLKAYYFYGSNGENVVIEEVPTDMEALVSEKRRELIETVSKVDDKLAEAFCSDKSISSSDLEEAVRRATIAEKFIPVFMGSAYKYKGLQLLLDGVLSYLPCPVEASNYALDQYKREEKVRRLLGRDNERHTLVASAFTLKKYGGHMTCLRIYEGVLRKGDFITDVDTSRKFEVRGLFGLYNDEVILEAHVGEIVGVIHSGPDNFTGGLARYTTTSIDVYESFSKDSGVQEKENSQQNARV